MKSETLDADALSAAVLEFFETQGSRKHTAHTIAKKFGVEHELAKDVLNTLHDKGKLNCCSLDISRGRWYSKLSKKRGGRHTLSVSAMKVDIAPRSFKEYKPGPEWDHINERLAEFRKIKSKF